MAAWFKLIGSSENPIPDFWAKERPDLLTQVSFPWNKPPSDIWAPGKLVIYATGIGTLVAVQSVAGPPADPPASWSAWIRSAPLPAQAGGHH